MIIPILLNDIITEISIDIDKIYRINGYGFTSCWFKYLENFEVPLFCGDYNSPSGIRITCEENELKIRCDNPLFYHSIVIESKPYADNGLIMEKTVDLSQAENITIVTQTGGTAYQLNGPFSADYNMIVGTDMGHTFDAKENLSVVAVQIGTVTYPCNGSGTQEGNKYSIQRFIPAYAAE